MSTHTLIQNNERGELSNKRDFEEKNPKLIDMLLHKEVYENRINEFVKFLICNILNSCHKYGKTFFI